MKLLLALILLFNTGLLPVNNNAPNVAGTWKVKGEVASTPVTPVCTIKQDDKNILSGTCKIMDTETALKGEVKDKNVTWQFNIDYNNDNLTVIFNGTVETDSKISGKINVQPYSIDGDFTAEKDAPK